MNTQKQNVVNRFQETPLSFSRELSLTLQHRNQLTATATKKYDGSMERRVQNTPSAFMGLNPEADKRKQFRLQAIQEIVTSEKVYLKQLEVLMRFFVEPIKIQCIIDGAKHNQIFGQIQMIYNLNVEFLHELDNNMEHVAYAFLKMAPYFKLYSVYAFDYKNALLMLQELENTNSGFRKFLKRVESRPEVQQKLNSLMIAPIQRVPRYKLLLEQVLLYTSPADKDFKMIKDSVKLIEDTILHINACVEEQEVTQALINLQNSLVSRLPNIVKPSRVVIKEGILDKITRHGTQVKRYCVLMSDIFMYCKILKDRDTSAVVENSLECSCIFPLKKSKVYELFPGNFKITCHGDGAIFGTDDLEVSRTWVKYIRDAVDLHIESRKTLRKESSKRTPLRKKGIKRFESENVLSPKRRKKDSDSTFPQNTNVSTIKQTKIGSTSVGQMLTKFTKRTDVIQSPISNATRRLTTAVKMPFHDDSEGRHAFRNLYTKSQNIANFRNTNETLSITSKNNEINLENISPDTSRDGVYQLSSTNCVGSKSNYCRQNFSSPGKESKRKQVKFSAIINSQGKERSNNEINPSIKPSKVSFGQKIIDFFAKIV